MKRMVERPEGSETPYRTRSGPYGRLWDSNQYPCVKPPWGSLTAIDMNKGEHRWRVTLGEFDELTAKGSAAHGSAQSGWLDCDGGRTGFYRGDQRRPLPGV